MLYSEADYSRAYYVGLQTRAVPPATLPHHGSRSRRLTSAENTRFPVTVYTCLLPLLASYCLLVFLYSTTAYRIPRYRRNKWFYPFDFSRFVKATIHPPLNSHTPHTTPVVTDAAFSIFSLSRGTRSKELEAGVGVEVGVGACSVCSSAILLRVEKPGLAGPTRKARVYEEQARRQRRTAVLNMAVADVCTWSARSSRVDRSRCVVSRAAAEGQATAVGATEPQQHRPCSSSRVAEAEALQQAAAGTAIQQVVCAVCCVLCGVWYVGVECYLRRKLLVFSS